MKLFNWSKRIFKKRCPICKSKNTKLEYYVSYAMNNDWTHSAYKCDDCNNFWIPNAPKD